MCILTLTGLLLMETKVFVKNIFNALKPKRRVVPLELNVENFWQAVKNSQKPVFVEFYSDTCVYCGRMLTTLEKFGTDFSDDVNIAKFNVGLDPEGKVVIPFKIRSVPTLIFFKNGNAVEEKVGITGYHQLKEMFEK